MTDFLIGALALAEQGFYVFPLAPSSKVPLLKGLNFNTESTRDKEQIKKWWSENPNANIGISTSRFGENEALLAVDVDVTKGKKGNDSILRHELSGNYFTPTRVQHTPTGGSHIIYRSAAPVKQGVSVLGEGLDIRSKGGYLVGAGSVIGGKRYTANAVELAQPPEWLARSFNTVSVGEPTATVNAVDEVRARARAVDYLRNQAPLAVQGAGGDQTTFVVAAKLKDLGCTADTAADLMYAGWNDRCSPPWEFSELRTKVKNAFSYGQKAAGSSAPEAIFPVLSPAAAAVTQEEKEALIGEEQNESYLDKINSEYALVIEEGSHSILHETISERGEAKRTFLSEATFKRIFSPYTVQQGKGKPLTHADIWLDWDGRRQYNGVCFAPEREARNGYYNLWRGFACEPLAYEDANERQREGFCMFMEHAKENVCLNNEEHFHWLISYFAHMVQKPYERPLTTLAFKGRKGVGKNALVDRVGNLLGQGHYLVAHDGRYLTSNFNGHLDSCLCLVLDEAFWSGDKSAEGKLKGLTTSPTILIERKGKEPYSIDNLVRLVVIGNEEWLVPASYDERRYAVFNVGEKRKQDTKYFERMRILIDECGGNRVLLHYLQTHKSTCNVNIAPITQGLLDQKTASLDPFHEWWLLCLHEEALICSEFGGTWQETISKERFRSAFKRYAIDRSVSSRLPDDRMVGKLLKNVAPSTITDQKAKDGENYTGVYRIPNIKQARKEWETFIGHPVWSE